MPPRTPLNRRRIAEAALQLIDEHGFDALTVRALAARLGVQSPSLYNHVSGKAEIFGAVTDLLGERIDLGTLRAVELSDALQSFARAYRSAFRGHPEVVSILARRPVSTASALRAYETAMTRLTDSGMTPRDAVRTLGALESVVLGSVILTFAAGLQGIDPIRAPITSGSLKGADTDAIDDAAFEIALDGLLLRITGAMPPLDHRPDSSANE